MALKLVIFDLDGTLIDSRETIFSAMVEGAKAIGEAPPSYDEARAVIGISLREALSQLKPHLSPNGVDAYFHAYREYHASLHARPGWADRLFDGGQACLKALRREGLLLGIATGNSRRGIDRFTRAYGWEDLFAASYSADESPSKPHPHMIEAQLSDLNIAPHEAVMIGDTTHDMIMARQAGVAAIGVDWGFHTPNELNSAGADIRVSSFPELEALLIGRVLTPLHGTVGNGVG